MILLLIALSFLSVSTFLMWLLQTTNLHRTILARSRRIAQATVEVNEAVWLGWLVRLGAVFQSGDAVTPVKAETPKKSKVLYQKLAGDHDQMELLLNRAGLQSQLSPPQLAAALLMGALLCAGGAMGLSFLMGAGLWGSLFSGGIGSISGLLILKLLVEQIGDRRIAKLERHLPYSMSLMAIIAGAVESPEAVLDAFCAQSTGDPLVVELQLVRTDLQNGLSLENALLALERRMQSSLLQDFIIATTTVKASGHSHHEVFKRLAGTTRQRRINAAEEIAKTAASRAIGPLMMVFFAAILLLLGPFLILFLNVSLF